jgi:3-dehydroquinate dehydratase-2
VKRVLVLNGPNLDTLGTRRPEIYGTTTLSQIEGELRDVAREAGLGLEFVQSASEQVLVEAISARKPDGIIINPAALTHFSHPLADALRASGVPVIEVHLSNIHAREQYRRLSVISPVARGVICGLGPAGYRFALEALARMLSGR